MGSDKAKVASLLDGNCKHRSEASPGLQRVNAVRATTATKLAESRLPQTITICLYALNFSFDRNASEAYYCILHYVLSYSSLHDVNSLKMVFYNKISISIHSRF